MVPDTNGASIRPIHPNTVDRDGFRCMYETGAYVGDERGDHRTDHTLHAGPYEPLSQGVGSESLGGSDGDCESVTRTGEGLVGIGGDDGEGW